MRPSPHPAPSSPAYDDVRRILVVANETVGGDALHDLLLGATAGGRATRVRVIVPVLHGRVLQLPPHLARRGGHAARAAAARLRACLGELTAEDVEADGLLADADPLVAMSRALREFPADLLVIATRPRARSAWMAYDVVRRADRAFGLPVAHVVVDDAALGATA